MTQAEKTDIIRMLDEGNFSCIIWNGGQATACRDRGVKDLFRLLTKEPQTLGGAFVADKVVGKGAAALMVLGGVREVYAAVISTPALSLLRENGVTASFGLQVPNILNRRRDGICPVEQLCEDCASAAECLPRIRSFLASLPAAD